MAVSEHDWLAVSRRAAERVRAELARFATAAERGVETGTGEGGDRTLVIDQAAEDAVLAELDALGTPMTVISEEGAGRSSCTAAAGCAPWSTRWMARSTPSAACPTRRCSRSRTVPRSRMSSSHVAAFEPELEWGRARLGRRRPGTPAPLEPAPEILGLETARPELVAGRGDDRLARCAASGRSAGAGHARRGARRARRDAEPAPIRSVDAAAGALLVREAGGAASS